MFFQLRKFLVIFIKITPSILLYSGFRGHRTRLPIRTGSRRKSWLLVKMKRCATSGCCRVWARAGPFGYYPPRPGAPDLVVESSFLLIGFAYRCSSDCPVEYVFEHFSFPIKIGTIKKHHRNKSLFTYLDIKGHPLMTSPFF